MFKCTICGDEILGTEIGINGNDVLTLAVSARSMTILLF
jgi:hypothetical protein